MKGITRAAALLALLALLLHGAAQAALPQPLEITEPRNAAVGYALTQASFVDRALAACAGVPGLAEASRSVRVRWEARNRPYVEAAGGWLLYGASMMRVEAGDAAARGFVDDTRALFDREAAAALDTVLPQGAPADSRCSALLRRFDDGSQDIARESEFRRDLEDIRAFHEAVAASVDD